MYATTDAFKAALIRSHRLHVSADLSLGGKLLRQGLPLMGGSVSVDRSAAVRRSATVQVVDTDGDLIPAVETDLLSPYGAELTLYRGLYVDPVVETYERVPLGVFRISVAEVQDEGAQLISVNAFDRARTVARNRFVDPYVIGAGTNYVTAVNSMIQSRLPGVTLQTLANTTQLTPLLVLDVGADPWDEAQKMVAAVGLICYFDQVGRFVIGREPDAAADPVVWEYLEGQDATMLRVRKDLSDEPGYNGVVLSAESTSLATPLRSMVWDQDPSSPTYYLGAYGKVPMVASSPYVSTQAGCDAAATLLLQQNIGGTEQVSFDIVPNPAHEAGDTIRIVRAASSIDDFVLLDSFQVPLGAGEAMPMTTRRRRTLA